MSRYIDREDLLKNLKRFAPEHLTPLIVMLIEKQPTADVVEVIRCKDCKHYKKINYDDISQNTCEITTKRQQPDDYCSYGERKE